MEKQYSNLYYQLRSLYADLPITVLPDYQLDDFCSIPGPGNCAVIQGTVDHESILRDTGGNDRSGI